MTLQPEIIQQAQAGDGAAFAAIIRAYKQRIFGSVYRLLGRSDEVEDVGQEVFLRLYQSLGQLRDPEVFETWLYRLTVNTVYDHLRKKRRISDVPMADLSEEQLLHADAAESARRDAIAVRQSSAREHLELLLGQISEEDRRLLERKEIDGLSLKELRRLYHANENALKVRLFRARKRALEAHAKLCRSETGAPAAARMAA
ncbi:MAG: sigma-70 family RNA polymerase sigma factor [Acidobacteria bacterium]|nr:sigma-70 family RNA polymerase sigma factor [Acidobacteriota bacterium]